MANTLTTLFTAPSRSSHVEKWQTLAHDGASGPATIQTPTVSTNRIYLKGLIFSSTVDATLTFYSGSAVIAILPLLAYTPYLHPITAKEGDYLMKTDANSAFKVDSTAAITITLVTQEGAWL